MGVDLNTGRTALKVNKFWKRKFSFANQQNCKLITNRYWTVFSMNGYDKFNDTNKFNGNLIESEVRLIKNYLNEICNHLKTNKNINTILSKAFHRIFILASVD